MKKVKTFSLIIFLNFVFTICSMQAGLAATHYVSPSGTVAWSICTSSYSTCSLNTANANASAGDVVILRGGRYTMSINPAKSGSAGNVITFQAYTGEAPIISTSGVMLLLGSRSYIKIDGITFENTTDTTYLMLLRSGASYNEIVNCVFDGKGSPPALAINNGLMSGNPSSHNWMHNCTIKNTGQVNTDCDDKGGMQIGLAVHDIESGHNTIENNVFYGGGHHLLETFTKYNIVRNNYFHNEGNMASPGTCPYGPDTNGKYGNRNISIYDGSAEDGKYNLIEGNRFGHAGPPPDDDGGDGFTIAAAKNIIRYNAIFNSLNNGVMFKTGYNSYADNNRFYNNTIYKSGRYKNSGTLWQGANFRWYGGYERVGNVIKNNILNSYGGTSEWMHGDVNIYKNNSATNNFCSPQTSTVDVVKKCYAYGDPQFVNPSVADPFSTTLPNLTPQNPAVINAGIHLTTVVGSGSGTALVVADALYFQDGTWGSALSNRQADWIAIGTVDNIVQIRSINYLTNTITLAASKSWGHGAYVWLYKKSDGAQVLYGPAPDVGAYETASTISAAVATSTGSTPTTTAIASSPTSTNIITATSTTKRIKTKSWLKLNR